MQFTFTKLSFGNRCTTELYVNVVCGTYKCRIYALTLFVIRESVSMYCACLALVDSRAVKVRTVYHCQNRSRSVDNLILLHVMVNRCERLNFTMAWKLFFKIPFNHK